MGGKTDVERRVNGGGRILGGRWIRCDRVERHRGEVGIWYDALRYSGRWVSCITSGLMI